MATDDSQTCGGPQFGAAPQGTDPMTIDSGRRCFAPRRPPVLVIAGMHRSGTSLVASLVAGAGIALGDRLLGVGHGNERGHFEDVDFLELHQKALRSCGFHGDGILPEGRIDFPVGLEARAGEILAARRAAGAPWGWKDPRTLLFLDYWAEQVPEATWLIVFRSPWEVADSLYRRLDEACVSDPLLALRAWEHANRRLLDFARRRPECCLVRELGQIVGDPTGTFALLRDRFGVPLGDPPIRYEPGLLGGDPSACGEQATLVRSLLPEIDALYGELRDVAGSRVPLPAPWRTGTESTATVAAVSAWARASRGRTIAAATREQALAAARADSERLLADERARSAESLAAVQAGVAESLAAAEARAAAAAAAARGEFERLVAEERDESERRLGAVRDEADRMLALERDEAARLRAAASDEAERRLAAAREEADRRFAAAADEAARLRATERDAWERQLTVAEAEITTIRATFDETVRCFRGVEAEWITRNDSQQREIESLLAEVRRLHEMVDAMSRLESPLPPPKPRTLAKLRREAARLVHQAGVASGFRPRGDSAQQSP